MALAIKWYRSGGVRGAVRRYEEILTSGLDGLRNKKEIFRFNEKQNIITYNGPIKGWQDNMMGEEEEHHYHHGWPQARALHRQGDGGKVPPTDRGRGQSAGEGDVGVQLPMPVPGGPHVPHLIALAFAPLVPLWLRSVFGPHLPSLLSRDEVLLVPNLAVSSIIELGLEFKYYQYVKETIWNRMIRSETRPNQTSPIATCPMPDLQSFCLYKFRCFWILYNLSQSYNERSAKIPLGIRLSSLLWIDEEHNNRKHLMKLF